MGAPRQVDMPGFPNIMIKKFIWGVLELLASGAPCTRLFVVLLTAVPAGKLVTAVYQVSEGENQEIPTDIPVSLVTSGYQVSGIFNGIQVSILLDTGAAVTLLREDVCKQMVPRSPDLK